MYLFDWMIADPICSIFIAIMIAMSVFSLIADSVKILMQRQPEQLDGKLQECYNKVRYMHEYWCPLIRIKLLMS